MQRYFFDLADEIYALDLQGIELPSIVDAKVEAIRFATDVFRERPELASVTGQFRVEVTDPSRTMIVTLETTPINSHSAMAISGPS